MPTQEDQYPDNAQRKGYQGGVKIAVIGAGWIGPRHAKAILEEPEAILCAIVDPTPTSKDLAISHSVPHYQSVIDLIESPDKPHGAIICTPNHTHVAIALELIAAGVAVIVEKPISTDIASGQNLIDASKSANVALMVGHHRRFNPYVSTAKQILNRATIGTVIAINGLWTAYKPRDYFTTSPWRQSKNTGGGVIMNNMIHEIDVLQFLLGRILRVYAETPVSHRGFDAEEGAAVTLRFESGGVVGTFLISDHVPSPHNFEAGTGENPAIPRTGRDFLRVFGTDGTLSLPDMMVSKYGTEVEKSWLSVLDSETMIGEVDGDEVAFRLQVRNFVEVMQGRSKPRCTGEDGLAALVVCEAIRKSLEEERPVEVAELYRSSSKL